MARLTTTTPSHETSTITTAGDTLMHDDNNEDDLPLALRRPRRKSSTTSLNLDSQPQKTATLKSNGNSKSTTAHGLNTPPSTPHRSKKRVRFTDPGPSTPNHFGISRDDDDEDDDLPSSSPSASASTGLTPFIRRTSLQPSHPSSESRSKSTTKSSSSKSRKRGTKRRRSAPEPNPNPAENLTSSPNTPVSGTMQFLPFLEIMDGKPIFHDKLGRRDLLRIRINDLSGTQHICEKVKKQTRRREKEVQEENERLKRELKKAEEEISEMRVGLQVRSEAGLAENGQGVEEERIREREGAAEGLRKEIERMEGDEDDGRDLFWADDEDEEDQNEDGGLGLDMDLDQEEDQIPSSPLGFGEGMDFSMGIVNDSEVLVSTPHRNHTHAPAHLLNQSHNSQDSSIPSPPATLPGTPHRSQIQPEPLSTPTRMQQDAEVQVDIVLPDIEKEQLKARLPSLEAELQALRTQVEKDETLRERLKTMLLPHLSATETGVHASAMEIGTETDFDISEALNIILTTLALSQSDAHEATARFDALSTSISTLGFSSAADPESTITQIETQFRTSRLKLEYLFPGETTTGFVPEKLLDLLLTRLQGLKAQVEKQESDIDQYHELEGNLRTQLAARVDAQRQLQGRLEQEKREKERLEQEIREKEGGEERLKGAIEKYRRDVKEVEELVEKLEGEGREKDEVVRQLRNEIDAQKKVQNDALISAGLEHEVLSADRDGLEQLSNELKRRLDGVLEEAEALKVEIEGVEAYKADLQRRLDAALAEEEAVQAEKADLLRKVADLEQQLASLLAEKESSDRKISELQETLAKREREHGAALALKDARFAEMRGELEEANRGKREAWKEVLKEKEKSRKVEERVQRKWEEKIMGAFRPFQAIFGRASVSEPGSKSGPGVVEDAREENEEIETERIVVDVTSGSASTAADAGAGTSVSTTTAARTKSVYGNTKGQGTGVRMMNGMLARRTSGQGKKRRKYDSAIGFLEEEDELDAMEE